MSSSSPICLSPFLVISVAQDNKPWSSLSFHILSLQPNYPWEDLTKCQHEDHHNNWIRINISLVPSSTKKIATYTELHKQIQASGTYIMQGKHSSNLNEKIITLRKYLIGTLTNPSQNHNQSPMTWANPTIKTCFDQQCDLISTRSCVKSSKSTTNGRLVIEMGEREQRHRFTIHRWISAVTSTNGGHGVSLDYRTTYQPPPPVLDLTRTKSPASITSPPVTLALQLPSNVIKASPNIKNDEKGLNCRKTVTRCALLQLNAWTGQAPPLKQNTSKSIGGDQLRILEKV